MKKRQINYLSKQLTRFTLLGLVMLLLSLTGVPPALADTTISADVGSDFITWTVDPTNSYERLLLKVVGPDETAFRMVFEAGEPPCLGLDALTPDDLPDGLYHYELSLVPLFSEEARDLLEAIAADDNRDLLLEAQGVGILPAEGPVLSGTFSIAENAFVTDASESFLRTDVVQYDDLIVAGSLCVGVDCVNGENFGYDTVRLKENNLRIHFQDTSISGSFPTRDWRIIINDSTNGGASYFAIEDSDAARKVFLIEGGAPANSLYVEDYGRVGLGTSTPVVELHIKDSDTPTVRLEQDNTGGWTPQTWDLAGNESNFFIRDATNGSKLPFRIQPSTPSSTLCLKSDGKVGIGTWSPGYQTEIETTGSNSELCLDRTDGSNLLLTASSTDGTLGTVSSHNLNLATDSTTRLTIDTEGRVGIGNETPEHTLDVTGEVRATGGFIAGSSRDLKMEIRELSTADAVKAVEGLEPVTYKYKANRNEQHVGFIAEDVPELVAVNGRKGLSSMDIVAVLTKVVKEQQKLIEEQKKNLQHFERRLMDLENQNYPNF